MTSTLSRIQYVEDPVGAAQKSDLVVEAIVENMAAKHDLFSKLDKAAPQLVNISSMCIPQKCLLMGVSFN